MEGPPTAREAAPAEEEVEAVGESGVEVVVDAFGETRASTSSTEAESPFSLWGRRIPARKDATSSSLMIVSVFFDGGGGWERRRRACTVS